MTTSQRVVLATVGALIGLGLSWELWVAPLRPGGSMLALKVVPLVLSVPGLAAGRVRVYQWWSMGVLLYLCEGLVRATSDQGTSAALAWVETGLASGMFVAILAFVRSRPRASRPPA